MALPMVISLKPTIPSSRFFKKLKSLNRLCATSPQGSVSNGIPILGITRWLYVSRCAEHTETTPAYF